MIHLGDVTKIDGANVPVVDTIIFGAPCQDISIAGLRKGMKHKWKGDDETTRSGLAFEAIRIIKEMRENDKRNGRSGVFVRPRFVVYENVPGAFSSNGGNDFRAVLEETIRIAEPDAPDIPCSKKWPLADAWYGDGWSVAYRVFDAQFWGVPQRRRRIALVADFGGHAAPEILFVRKGVCGDTEEIGETEETAAAGAGGGADCTVWNLQGNAIDRDAKMNGFGIAQGAMFTLNTVDRHAICAGFKAGNGAKANSIGFQEEISPTLSAAESGTNQVPSIICIATQQGGAEIRSDDKAPTLTAAAGMSGNNQPVVYDARGNGDGKTACTLTGDHQSRVTDYTAIVMATGQANAEILREKAPTLNCDHEQPIVFDKEVYNTVRRLTPLECERLQGYPDGWTDIGPWTDSAGKLHKESSDSARYKALGNSIALPPWKWVLKRLCACYERDAAMGSLFDGIGGFPLIWERLNGPGSCLWASEIEEFPMAVTRRRFGGS